MSAAGTYAVRAPRWVLKYRGVNVTRDISHMVLGVAYTDRLGGASGEMTVVLEDRDRRWQGPWRPNEGDEVSLALGYGDEELLEAGEFQVDELELEGPPDVMHMRCLGAFITPAMRTRTSAGYENHTLLTIAGLIAAKHGLRLVGAPVFPGVVFRRITQRHETDLGFLRRLARAHGYDFTVRGRKLVFYSEPELESRPAVAALRRGDLERYELKARTHETYRDAALAYFFSEAKSLVSNFAAALAAVATGDTLKFIARAEDAQQAALKAAAALRASNRGQVTCRANGPGIARLVAGSNVELRGFGAMDGKYLVETAHHRLDREHGYTTQFEGHRVEQRR